MVLPVRHDDDDLLAHPLFIESGHRRLNCLRNHGSLPRDRVRASVAEVGLRGGIVERQRELDEARPGEQDDADLVAGEPRHHVGYLQLGAVEARGLEVLGQHTARNVEGDHDLHAAMLDDLHVAAPLRTGERDNDKGDADEPQDEPATAHPPVDGRAEPLDEGGIADASHRGVTAQEGPPHEDHQRGKRDEGISDIVALRMSSHGIFLNTGLGEDQLQQEQQSRAGTRNHTASSR